MMLASYLVLVMLHKRFIISKQIEIGETKYKYRARPLALHLHLHLQCKYGCMEAAHSLACNS